MRKFESADKVSIIYEMLDMQKQKMRISERDFLYLNANAVAGGYLIHKT